MQNFKLFSVVNDKLSLLILRKTVNVLMKNKKKPSTQ